MSIDPLSCPTKFEAMQPHMRLAVAYPIFGSQYINNRLVRGYVTKITQTNLVKTNISKLSTPI